MKYCVSLWSGHVLYVANVEGKSQNLLDLKKSGNFRCDSEPLGPKTTGSLSACMSAKMLTQDRHGGPGVRLVSHLTLGL